jgi:hypothetical protein
MTKLKMWNAHPSWESAEKEWDSGKVEAEKVAPIKGLKSMPSMVGITEETARNLKWKSLKWMLTQDHKGEIRREFLKHPLKYSLNYIKSIFKSKSYYRDGDFFYYGVKDINEFENLLKNNENLLVLGFSYCHKPFECPSGRFTSDCIHDPENPVCRQCFIGKAIHALPDKNCFPVVIPTVHHIAGRILEISDLHPGKKVLFIITACEMTLEMFGDWGNMAEIRGIGVRLDGRICNTMRAFELSEQGIKPGLTVVLESSKVKILDLIKHRRGRGRGRGSNSGMKEP